MDDSIITTERLTLRPLTVACAVEMVHVLADDELYSFTGGQPPTLPELTSRYESQVAGSGDEREVWFNWIVRRSSDDVAVGFVQTDLIDGVAELAWLLGVQFQGRGYASEAADALRRHFLEMGALRVTAHIHPDHVASGRVATKIGLTRTTEVDADGESIWEHSA